MKIEELVSNITKLKQDGKITKHTVEFVLNDKKYYFKNISQCSDGITISLNRENYNKLTVDELLSELLPYPKNSKCFLTDDKNVSREPVTDSYLTHYFFEIFSRPPVVEKPAVPEAE